MVVQGGATAAAASPGALLLQSWAPAALPAKVKRATCAPGKCSGLPARHPPNRAAYTEHREGREKTVGRCLERCPWRAHTSHPGDVCQSLPPLAGRTVAGGAWPVKVWQCRHEAQSSATAPGPGHRPFGRPGGEVENKEAEVESQTRRRQAAGGGGRGGAGQPERGATAEGSR